MAWQVVNTMGQRSHLNCLPHDFLWLLRASLVAYTLPQSAFWHAKDMAMQWGKWGVQTGESRVAKSGATVNQEKVMILSLVHQKNKLETSE
jgi:hypothetical protein